MGWMSGPSQSVVFAHNWSLYVDPSLVCLQNYTKPTFSLHIDTIIGVSLIFV